MLTRSCAAVVSVAVALAVSGCGSTGGGSARDAAVNPTPRAELVLPIPGMAKARVRRGLVYATRADGPLRMDVYRPAKTSDDALPAVLVGGPPDQDAGKDSAQKVGWSQLIAASGLAAVAFDIRSDQFLRTPAAPTRDVSAAIRYVRSHAAALGIDPNRLCTLGFSLGTAPWHLSATMRAPKPYVRCNVVYYGALDFHDDAFFMKPKLVDAYSALTFLRAHGARIAPMLVVKAGRDRFREINRSIDRFVAAAQRSGAPVTLLTHPTAPHGFDLTQNDGRAREIISATLAFFRERLGAR